MDVTLIRIKDLSFSYEPGKRVLDAVRLEIKKGERIVLGGPNGAGKTTLLHLMVGLLRPDSGEIEAFGRSRKEEQDFRDVRARAGLLFQEAEDQLFCPRVMEDVAFGPLNLGMKPRQVKAVVTETLARLGLEGYENRITHKLSGGEKRMVSLATVLAMKPDLLLLDEPTSSLDEEAVERVIKVLLELRLSMLIVSHHQPFLRALATRTVTLRDGKIRHAENA